MNILKEIINYKKKNIIFEKKNNKIFLNLKKKSFFKLKLANNIKKNKISIIAEIKKASPSKGILKKKFDSISIAKQYIDGGATCLSVLTEDKFFLGNKNYIKKIKKKYNIPILAKDFFIDPFQIYEAKSYGADCILILLSAMKEELAKELYDVANKCGLDTIVEVHNEKEMTFALNLKKSIIGINNRNLKTFVTNINNTINLFKKFNLKNRMVVSESGFNSKKDILRISRKTNIKTFLIGESLIKSNNIKKKISSFL
ncbi:MAG: indole-3-glycerol phosphate synthase TrpC, partial [Candidatus Fonsibacter sp.]